MGTRKIDRGAEPAKEHGIARSPQWKTARKNFLKVHSFCDACGPGIVRAHLQVHHIIPFHLCLLLGRPDMELDTRNLIVLCEDDGFDHHLLLGHFDNFKSNNPDIKTSANSTYFGWPEQKIRSDMSWKQQTINSPKEWSDMSDTDKAKLREAMDALCPRATIS